MVKAINHAAPLCHWIIFFAIYLQKIISFTIFLFHNPRNTFLFDHTREYAFIFYFLKILSLKHRHPTFLYTSLKHVRDELRVGPFSPQDFTKRPVGLPKYNILSNMHHTPWFSVTYHYGSIRLMRTICIHIHVRIRTIVYTFYLYITLMSGHVHDVIFCSLFISSFLTKHFS